MTAADGAVAGAGAGAAGEGDGDDDGADGGARRAAKEDAADASRSHEAVTMSDAANAADAAPPSVVAVIQARMTSSRLPGKVLADLGGRPMLEQQVRRVRAASTLDAIWIATTTNAADDPVADLAARLGLGLVRGDEQDVLGRYLTAADRSGADVLVRLTADCPLADAGVIDRVVRLLADHPAADYASNVEPRSFPRGLDCEAVRVPALRRAAADAGAADREHVTLTVRRSPDFARVTVSDTGDNADLRWTVDEPPDLAMVRAIHAGMDLDRRLAPYAEILAWVRARPEIAAINAGIETTTG